MPISGGGTLIALLFNGILDVLTQEDDALTGWAGATRATFVQRGQSLRPDASFRLVGRS